MNDEVKKIIQKEADQLEATNLIKQALLETYENGGLKFEGKDVEQVAIKKMQLKKDLEINTVYLQKIRKLLEPETLVK